MRSKNRLVVVLNGSEQTHNILRIFLRNLATVDDTNPITTRAFSFLLLFSALHAVLFPSLRTSGDPPAGSLPAIHNSQRAAAAAATATRTASGARCQPAHHALDATPLRRASVCHDADDDERGPGGHLDDDDVHIDGGHVRAARHIESDEPDASGGGENGGSVANHRPPGPAHGRTGSALKKRGSKSACTHIFRVAILLLLFFEGVTNGGANGFLLIKYLFIVCYFSTKYT